MKRILEIIIAAALAAAAVSCHKPDPVKPKGHLDVTGTLPEATKVTVNEETDAITASWEVNDVIFGFWEDAGTIKQLSYKVKSIEGGKARFTYVSGTEPLADGTAVHMVYSSNSSYRQFAADGTLAIDLSTQSGEFSGIKDNILFCASASLQSRKLVFSFENQTALVDIKEITGMPAGTKFSKLELEAAGIASGTIQLSGNKLTLVPSDATASVSATFQTARTATSPVWFAVCPISETDLLASVTADNGLSYEKGLRKAFAAGKCYDVKKLSVYEKIRLIGEFSVAAGKKVAFTPGNLNATRSGSSVSWSFAAHQYDCVRSATMPVMDVTGNGTFDLFGWSTSASANERGLHTAIRNDAGSVEYENAVSGTFQDWGGISIGGAPAGTYRTLTKDEWTYLLTQRSGSTVAGVPDARYFKGMGNIGGGTYVKGLFLLPDNFVCPSGYESRLAGVINMYAMDFNDNDGDNVFTQAEFNELLNAGTVFLPAAGFRGGTSVWFSTVTTSPCCGLYWSSTAADNTFEGYGTCYNAYGLYFYEAGVESEIYGSIACDRINDRSAGCSVRLVKDL